MQLCVPYESMLNTCKSMCMYIYIYIILVTMHNMAMDLEYKSIYESTSPFKRTSNLKFLLFSLERMATFPGYALHKTVAKSASLSSASSIKPGSKKKLRLGILGIASKSNSLG